MKKIYTIALTLLAGAALVSCEPEQLVQIDPGQTVAPVLKTFEGGLLYDNQYRQSGSVDSILLTLMVEDNPR